MGCSTKPSGWFGCGLLLLITAFILAAFPAGARAAQPGVVPDLTWFPSETDRARTATALQDVGSKWVRLDLGWRDFEPSPGSYSSWSIAAYEQELQRARAAGQKIILMVHKSPKWASGSDNEQAPPVDPADYARFLRFLGTRYGDYVDAWEIWNEQNYSHFWPTGPDPAKYTELLKAAYPAIKETDPTAEVVFGGLTTNDWGFVEGAYAAGAKGYFDVMATHPYSCTKSPETINSSSDGRMTKDSFPAYREVREVMLANGDPKPIWFTEFGWSSASTGCGVGASTQADYLTRAYEYIEQDPYVEVATWYNFRNNFWAGDVNETGPQYGLMTTDFTPKPAYEALKSYAGGAGFTSPPPSPGGTNEPPAVEFTSPSTGSTFTKTLRMTASASDDSGVAKVTFALDGKTVRTDFAAPFEYSYAVPRRLAYGEHLVEVVAYDGGGLTASDRAAVTRVR